MINLLKELDSRQDFEVAFFMTYTLNLRFFETVVLPLLRRMNVARVGILVDRKGYEDSLADPLAQGECGESYVLVPAKLPHDAMQHAKLLWLQGRSTVAYVGSHNLTGSGYNDQLEFTARLESTDPSHCEALRALHETVTGLLPNALRPVWAHTSAPLPVDSPKSVRFLSSASGPLLDQLVDLVRNADELRVVTPFLEPSALHSLAERLRASRVTVDGPSEGFDTPIEDAINSVPGLTARALPAGSRRLHAKAYEFRSGSRSELALGSANCTQAALGRGLVDGGNLEFLLLVDDASLPDDVGARFDPIEDPLSFPSTGRAWSEGRTPAGPLSIELAEYRDGVVTVEWHDATDGKIEELFLVVGEQRFAATASPLRIELPPEDSPSMITLVGRLHGVLVERSSWIVRWDRIEAHAARRWSRRWVEAIGSSDPSVNVAGIALWLNALRGIYSEGETHPAFKATARGDLLLRTSDVQSEKAIEIFGFSRDVDYVRDTAVQFVAKNGETDAFAILRALLARYAAPPPARELTDAEAVRQQAHVRAAAHNLTDSLHRYLTWLVTRNESWDTVPPAQARAFWQLTFVVLSQAWYLGCVRDRAYIAPTKRHVLVDSFISVLQQLAKDPTARMHLSDDGVARWLLLSLCAMADAAESDATQLRRLAAIGTDFIGSDPRATFEKRFTTSDQLRLVPQEVLARARTDFGRLFGFADNYTRGVIERDWGLLKRLQIADMTNGEDRHTLMREADATYRASPIWMHYLRARNAHRLPVLFEIGNEACPRCHIRLPLRQITALHRGEAVLCDSWHILVLRG